MDFFLPALLDFIKDIAPDTWVLLVLQLESRIKDWFRHK